MAGTGPIDQLPTIWPGECVTVVKYEVTVYMRNKTRVMSVDKMRDRILRTIAGCTEQLGTVNVRTIGYTQTDRRPKP